MTDDDNPRFSPRLRDELAHRRVLLLDGPLDDVNGAEVLARLLLLAAEDAKTDITLWIHSPGGSVPAMLAIRDAMRVVPCDVVTVAMGLAGSAVEVEVQADDLRHTRDAVLRLVAQDTGQDLERIFEDSLHDRWFTAEEALEYGFVDHLAPDLAQLVPSSRGRAAGLGVPS